MEIAITRNKKSVVKKAKLCNNMLTRLVGLMFSKPQAAVITSPFESIVSTTIHTFFMRFPIDAIWLNKELEVVDVRKNIKPYRTMVAPKKKAMYILEMPTAKNNPLKEGDKVKFHF